MAKMQPFWWFLPPVLVTYGYNTWRYADNFVYPWFMFKLLDIVVPAKVRIRKMQCAFSNYISGTVTAYGIIVKDGAIIAFTSTASNDTSTPHLYDLPVALAGDGVTPITYIDLEPGTYDIMVRLCSSNYLAIWVNGGGDIGAAGSAYMQMGSCYGFDTTDNNPSTHAYVIAMVGELR